MIQQMHCVPEVDASRILTPFQWKGLGLLSEAWRAAEAAGCHVWQFAVEIDQLRALGLSHTDLRSLLCRGYLEHAQERTSAGAPQRIFQHLGTLVLPRRTCFVLTAKGREALAELAAESCSSAASPRWDNSSRQLCWQNTVIKEFRRPAVNQELVLAALEEEGWPAQIDDPLPPTDHIDPKVRLHDTIRGLNRHHLCPILHFRGDGTGQGIQWFFVTWSRNHRP